MTESNFGLICSSLPKRMHWQFTLPHNYCGFFCEVNTAVSIQALRAYFPYPHLGVTCVWQLLIHKYLKQKVRFLGKLFHSHCGGLPRRKFLELHHGTLPCFLCLQPAEVCRLSAVLQQNTVDGINSENKSLIEFSVLTDAVTHKRHEVNSTCCCASPFKPGGGSVGRMVRAVRRCFAVQLSRSCAGIQVPSYRCLHCFLSLYWLIQL